VILEVDEQESRFGALLQTTKPWSGIKKSWSEIKAKRYTSADASEREHNQLTASLVDLILNYAGNYSNLILDPDLDSYWLMDAFITKLPALTETLGKASLLSAKSTNPGAEDRIELAGLYKTGTTLLSDLMSINMATVYKENKSGTSRPALEDAARRSDAAVNKHFADLRQRSLVAGSDPFGGSGEALVNQSMSTVDEVFQFWSKVGPELDSLILTRVRSYSRQRAVGFLTLVLATGILVYAFLAFYRSVQGSVRSLREATGRLIQGTTETFRFAARDELGQVASSYNEINRALL
jgi:methyl-accepting chemotaxis protein